MYCTYVLKSLTNGDIYIGSSGDLYERTNKHNKGKVRSTKTNRPWKLLEYYKFNTRSEAVKYEKFLKTHQQKEIIRRKNNIKAR